MGLERLWAGWRLPYVEAADAEHGAGPCVFCRLGAADDPDEALVVRRGTRVYVVLNAYPYTSGHLMVVPVRHEGELDALDADEAAEVMALTQQAVAAVRRAYGADGVNVGINLGAAAGAGVPGHLHVHVVPRWHADTNFMTAVAETRVLPEALGRSLARLRAAWDA
jgi:ATP adenylyltransferase